MTKKAKEPKKFRWVGYKWILANRISGETEVLLFPTGAPGKGEPLTVPFEPKAAMLRNGDTAKRVRVTIEEV